MDILYILIPLSVFMAIIVIGGLWWAIYRGQFDDIEEEGKRVMALDTEQYLEPVAEANPEVEKQQK